jgi:hypothetical protein
MQVPLRDSTAPLYTFRKVPISQLPHGILIATLEFFKEAFETTAGAAVIRKSVVGLKGVIPA